MTSFKVRMVIEYDCLCGKDCVSMADFHLLTPPRELLAHVPMSAIQEYSVVKLDEEA